MIVIGVSLRYNRTIKKQVLTHTIRDGANKQLAEFKVQLDRTAEEYSRTWNGASLKVPERGGSLHFSQREREQ